ELAVLFIQSIVSTSGSRLAYLETEISRLQERLKELEEERASLASYRAEHAILSPLRRIPPEVLGEIFVWTLPDALNAGRDLKDSPWLLTHISRRWRETVLSTPSLWSFII
ncbi:hypothetical protein C8R44DRAFT_549326, partial [Mycena epipterygia]